MPITAEARQRLTSRMEARRLELGLSWRELADRSGVSYESLRALRQGAGGIRPLTAAKISQALGWTAPSVENILSGGDAEPSPSGAHRSLPPGIVRDNWGDPFVQRLWSYDDASEDHRLALIEEHLRLVAAKRTAG